MTSLKISLLIFAFNRPGHLKQVLDSLPVSAVRRLTTVRIIIDGPNDPVDEALGHQCMQLSEEFATKFDAGFVKIQPRLFNRGLRSSILGEISSELEAVDAVIVLEDDVVVHAEFVDYMIKLLNWYWLDKSIGHINGHNPVEERLTEFRLYESIYMDCWGWATWRDRWLSFNRNPRDLLNRLRNLPQSDKTRFSYKNSNSALWQIKANAVWRKETWAANWYASLFLAGYKTIYPSISLVRNIGQDGTGVNCGELVESREPPVLSSLIDWGATINNDASRIKALECQKFENSLTKFFRQHKPSLYQKINHRVRALWNKRSSK